MSSPGWPEEDRYDAMSYRRCGRSGLELPALALGMWQNFGTLHAREAQRDIVRRAFDLGVTHIDLANNYGPPPGAAEEVFGELLDRDLRPHLDELVIATKAGWPMWAGPYGDHGSRKHLLTSLDQSLRRMRLDHVDVFYHHRPDPQTPLEETMGALHAAVLQGKALYVGVSAYSPEETRAATAVLADMGTRLLVHQPSYSIIDRSIEAGLLDVLEELGLGCVVFSALAQGLLTDRYLDGVPPDSRLARGETLPPGIRTDALVRNLRKLDAFASDRGQSLAQLALTWTLRDPRVTSAIIGVSTVEQLETNLAALQGTPLSDDEVAWIDGWQPWS